MLFAELKPVIFQTSFLCDEVLRNSMAALYKCQDDFSFVIEDIFTAYLVLFCLLKIALVSIAVALHIWSGPATVAYH